MKIFLIEGMCVYYEYVRSMFMLVMGCKNYDYMCIYVYWIEFEYYVCDIGNMSQFIGYMNSMCMYGYFGYYKNYFMGYLKYILVYLYRNMG